MATHDGLGATRTPGSRASSDVAALGVDLGDRERLRLPAALEQADGEGFAHAAAADECQVHPGRVSVADCARRVRASGRRPGAGEPEERSVAAPHFPERDGPSCTSGPHQPVPVGIG